MFIHKFKFLYNSIAFKLIMVIFLILAPMISLLIYNNYKTREVLLEQVKGTHRNMLQTYLTQIDTQLYASMSYTLDMALFQSDPLLIARDTDEASVAYAKYRVFNSFLTKLVTNNYIDAFFLYDRTGGNFLIAAQQNVSSTERDVLKNYIANAEQEDNPSTPLHKASWIFTNTDTQHYLINLSYSNDNSLICGAYINTSRLLNNYIKSSNIMLDLSLLSPEAYAIQRDSLPDGTLFITSRSTEADFYLAELLPGSEVLDSLPFLQKYIFLISILLICMLPVLIFLMNLILANPLKRLTRSMVKIRSGNLDYRMKTIQGSNEFLILNDTFNEMMDEVQNLKIDIYEERIKVQKSQLRNLQLQIKPHFLLNSLNMVSNLIQNENNSAAIRLVHYSSDYFRYMGLVEYDFVPLNQEITHVSNYMEIQKIRYAGKINYTVTINQLIEDMLVPPMLIQNLIENSIKYAIDMEKILTVSVTVDYYEVDLFPYAKIIISDTGIGYPVEILDRLNSGQKITDSRGEHIGIYNSVQRLHFLYEGKASWKFYNNSGAVSEITLPAIFQGLDNI